MNRFKLRVADIRARTDRIVEATHPSASKELVNDVTEELKDSIKSIHKENDSFVLFKGLDGCCDVFAHCFLLGVITLVTILAIILIAVLTTICLRAYKYDEAKYYYAGAVALVIVAAWAGMFYKFFYEPRLHLEENSQRWKDIEPEYENAFKDYENAVKKFKERDIVVALEKDRNDILDNLDIAQDFQDPNRANFRPNPNNSDCQVQPLKSSQNFESIY